MRIVEEDFIIEPCSERENLWDLTFLKKVKNENGEVEVKKCKPAYGCSLASCITRVIRHRRGTKFESESAYLLDALKESNKLLKEMVTLCRESLPEKFDTGE